MRNGATEGPVFGPLRIHVNPLVVIGGIGKLIDAILINGHPLRGPKALTRGTWQLAELNLHARWLDTDTISPVM